MITITATNLRAHETTTVAGIKSISAAWNEIRKIRDQFKDDPTKGEGITLKINMGEMEPSDRLPLEIIFMANKKGKLEFKDLQKIREKAMARMNEKDEEETEDYPDQGEEYMEKDLALSTL
jgi:hypothetical protein